MRSVVVLFSFLILSACAGRETVSEYQCAAGDWQTLGYRDGVNGYRSSQLLEHQHACMQYGIVPDRAGYMLGWDEGVRQYCDPNNGFNAGQHGWDYQNVCPSDLREGFVEAYREGRRLYLARVAVANLEAEINRKTQRIEAIKSEMVSVASAQINPELTVDERIRLAAKLQNLHAERERLIAELPQLEHELAVKARELDRLSQLTAQVLY